jgi:hypothetical protein
MASGMGPGVWRAHRALDDTDLRRFIIFKDDMISTNSDTGRLGESGWWRTALAGTAANGASLDSAAGTFGIKRIVTAASAADATGWSTIQEVLAANTAGMRLDVRIQAETLVTCRWFLGLTNDDTTIPIAATAVGFMGFRYDTAVDQLVRGVTKTGSAAETLVTCGTVDATAYNTYTFDMPDASTVRFFKNGVHQGTSTATIPTGTYHLCFGIQTDANASSRFRIDLFQFSAPLDRG